MPTDILTDLLVYSLEVRNLVVGPSSKLAMQNLPPVLSPGIQNLWDFWKALSLIKSSGGGNMVGWRISWDFLSHRIPNLIKGVTAHAQGQSRAQGLQPRDRQEPCGRPEFCLLLSFRRFILHDCNYLKHRQ